MVYTEYLYICLHKINKKIKIMKKILLSAVALMGLTAATAQVYTANDSAAFSVWTFADLDGDSNDFLATDVSWLTNSLSSQAGCMISQSWATNPLTPDNVAVSPVMDLSGTASVTLEFSVGNPETTASGWYEEHYAVYVVTTAAEVAGIAAGNFPAPVLETTLVGGETMYTETIDLAAAAGQSAVYIAFRHFNCTDENFLIVDDLTVSAEFVGTEESSLEVLSAFPNPTTEVLNIHLNANVASVSVLSLDGKLISNEVVNSSNVVLNVADLAVGVYFYEVTTTDGDKIRNKFIKK